KHADHVARARGRLALGIGGDAREGKLTGRIANEFVIRQFHDLPPGEIRTPRIPNGHPDDCERWRLATQRCATRKDAPIATSIPRTGGNPFFVPPARPSHKWEALLSQSARPLPLRKLAGCRRACEVNPVQSQNLRAFFKASALHGVRPAGKGRAFLSCSR